MDEPTNDIWGALWWEAVKSRRHHRRMWCGEKQLEVTEINRIT